MKVGDLVFSNGAIAIIVGEYGKNRTRVGKFFRLYYFRYGCFGNSPKYSVVPVSDDIR